MRPILFIGRFAIIYAIALLNKFNYYLMKSRIELERSGVEFVECLLGPNGSSAHCGEHPEVRVSIVAVRFLELAL
jgi:hypothetical protein